MKLMRHLDQELDHPTEIGVKKKQYQEKFKFIGVLLPKPNQRVFKCDTETGEVTECEYFANTDTVHYLEVLNGTYKKRERNVKIEDGFDYVVKLNIDNAVKHFNKKYKAHLDVFAGEKVNQRNFKNQTKINLVK